MSESDKNDKEDAQGTSAHKSDEANAENEVKSETNEKPKLNKDNEKPQDDVEVEPNSYLNVPDKPAFLFKPGILDLTYTHQTYSNTNNKDVNKSNNFHVNRPSLETQENTQDENQTEEDEEATQKVSPHQANVKDEEDTKSDAECLKEIKDEDMFSNVVDDADINNEKDQTMDNTEVLDDEGYYNPAHMENNIQENKTEVHEEQATDTDSKEDEVNLNKMVEYEVEVKENEKVLAEHNNKGEPIASTSSSDVATVNPTVYKADENPEIINPNETKFVVFNTEIDEEVEADTEEKKTEVQEEQVINSKEEELPVKKIKVEPEVEFKGNEEVFDEKNNKELDLNEQEENEPSASTSSSNVSTVNSTIDKADEPSSILNPNDTHIVLFDAEMDEHDKEDSDQVDDDLETDTNDMMDLADTHLQCPICMEVYIGATSLNCGHTFCQECIGKWRKKNKHCPVCRSRIRNMAPCTALDMFIEEMFGLLDQEGLQRRRQFVMERGEKKERK